MAKKIGELLVEAGTITRKQLHDALEEQRKSGRRIGSVLIQQGVVKEAEMLSSVSRQLGVPAIDLETFQFELELAKEHEEFLTKLIGVKLPFRLAKWCFQARMSNTLIFGLMTLIGVAGACLLTVNHLAIFFGFLLLIGFYVFDYVGEQVARMNKQISLINTVRHHFLHFIIEVLALLCFGIWLINTGAYEQWFVFLMMFILLFWQKSQKFLAHVRLLVYFAEIMEYPLSQADMLRQHYTHLLTADKLSEAIPVTATTPLKRVIARFRSVASSFTFFVFVMMLVSLSDYLLIMAGIHLHLKLLTVQVFAIYYTLNILDFSYRYLCTDKIYQDVKAVEQVLTQTPP